MSLASYDAAMPAEASLHRFAVCVAERLIVILKLRPKF